MNDVDDTARAHGPEADYRAALAHGELVLQRCERCEARIFYPRLLCPSCGSRNLQATASSLRGVVYATTTVRQRPDAGGDYNVALIDLDEGPRMMSRVVGVPPHEVRIGDRVRGRVVEQDGDRLVVFETL